ncbi:LVIVD repeat-containing protein [Chitinophaga barathri]|nr:hypothetical protein [Chitinophaga barathri]
MKTRILLICGLVAVLFAGCSKQDGSNNNYASENSGSGKGGSMARFAISGNYLYVVNSNSLLVYDISDPAMAVPKSTVAVGWEIETIFPYDDKLFIGSTTGLFIFELKDPEHPNRLGAVQHFRACDPVVTQGNTAYLTLRGNGTCGSPNNSLMVYDVTNPTQPILKNQLNLKGPYGLGVHSNALYVCDGADGLVVYDVTIPLYPKTVKTIKDGSTFLDVIPYNDVLIVYVKGGVRFFDISTPQNPVLLSEMLN